MGMNLKSLGMSVLGAVLVAGISASQASALDFDQEVPQGTQTQMTADLAFIGTLQGAKVTPLHQQVYGAMQGATYSNWFSSRVKSVGYTDDDMGGAVAYVPPMFDSSKMVLTKNFTSFDHPQIARLMVVFHEARHTEDDNGNWPHATCPTPFKDAAGNDMKSIWTGLPLAGQPGCDDQSVGAYGSSTVLLKNVSLNCSNCNEKVKMDAGIFADDQLGRIIDPSAHQALVSDFQTAAF